MGRDARLNDSAELKARVFPIEKRMRTLEQRNGQFVQSYNALVKMVGEQQQVVAALLAGNQALVKRVAALEQALADHALLEDAMVKRIEALEDRPSPAYFDGEPKCPNDVGCPGVDVCDDRGCDEALRRYTPRPAVLLTNVVGEARA